jgi:GDPmannose 4,6-dehydratase
VHLIGSSKTERRFRHLRRHDSGGADSVDIWTGGQRKWGKKVPRALITGITGQDGLYLAEFLTAKGYDVFGMVRGQSNPKIPTVEDLIPSIQLLEGDLRDLSSLIGVLEIAQPDEIYNLGAISFVGLSFKQPELTGDITGMGVLRMLEAVRIHTQGSMEGVRFYQASSSEMFGATDESPQRETTQFHPRSPYGAAKAFGHHVTQNYREAYNAWACSGILFNHESPRRGFEFVTRKVTRAVARIALGRQKVLAVGNMDASRDWGFAGDYVEAMWLMLQQDEPDDYVIATGKTHSVGDLLQVAFHHVGIKDWRPYVAQDARFFRPADISALVGDSTKARSMLGWGPRVNFQQVIEMMVDADLEIEKRNLLPADGISVPLSRAADADSTVRA